VIERRDVSKINEYVEGITVATKRRAYMRGKDLSPIYDRVMVSIDISNVSFS